MFGFTSHVLLSFENYKCVTAMLLDLLSGLFMLVSINNYADL